MDIKHHCNGCPHWHVTQKKYPSGFYNITICGKYNKQLYYLAGEENRTPHPCDICSKRFSYVPYIPIKIKNEWSCDDCKRTTFCGVCERPGIWMNNARKKLEEYKTAEEEEVINR